MSAVAGVVTLVLLSRSLPAEAYASYFALWAAVEIVVLASNGGLMHAAYRYVQARENSGAKGFVIYGPASLLLGLRTLSLPFGVAVFLLLPVAALSPADPGQRSLLMLAFALVCVLEGLARYCELMFESLMLQEKAQITLLLRAVLKPLGIISCLANGPLQLEQVLFVEVVACGVAALVAVSLLILRINRSTEFGKIAADGDVITLKRVRQFVLPAYLAQLLTLCYGPDLLKLVLLGGSEASMLAVFGFAFSLAAMVQRYLPVVVLGGIFRPLFVAAAGRVDADELLSRLFSVLCKLNWFVVAIPLVALAPSSAVFTSTLSGGNYPESGSVLLLLLVGTGFLAVHGVLSLHCLAKEQSRSVLLATLMAACSLPLAVVLANYFGANGLALGWAFGELVWVLACMGFLKRNNCLPSLKWDGLLKIPMLALAIAALSASLAYGLPALAMGVSFLGPVLLLLLCKILGVFDEAEKKWFMSVMPPRLQRVFSTLIG